MQMLDYFINVGSFLRSFSKLTEKQEFTIVVTFTKCALRKVQLKGAYDLFLRRESSMKNLCNRYFSFNASFACMQRRFFDYTM